MDRRSRRAPPSPAATLATLLIAMVAVAALVLVIVLVIEQRREAERLVREPAEIVPAPADTVIDPPAPGGMARFERGVA
jgi:hypothetical protein